MRQYRRYVEKIFSFLFKLLFPITLIVYLLRGFGILGSMPGGILLTLMVLSMFTGIVYFLEKTGGF